MFSCPRVQFVQCHTLGSSFTLPLDHSCRSLKSKLFIEACLNLYFCMKNWYHFNSAYRADVIWCLHSEMKNNRHNTGIPLTRGEIILRNANVPSTVWTRKSPTADQEKENRCCSTFVEKCARIDDSIQLSVVRWFDNRPVTFLSSFVGAQPVANARRWDRTVKADKQIPCPQVVTIYNRRMGGVDLLDSLIGLYRCKLCSKKWHHRISLHLSDLTVVIAWLLYKRVHHANASEGRMMRLHEFKCAVAEGLCYYGKTTTASKVSKKRRLEEMTPVPAKRLAATAAPSVAVTKDQVGHFPKWTGKRQHCKLAGYQKLWSIVCRKCGVNPCFSSRSDCYYTYHC